MPQLDPTWFVSQIFWLVIMFGVLYVMMANFALPPIDKVLDERRTLIEGDIKKATELKEEAESALKTYEDALAGANAEAKKIIADAKEEMSLLSAKREKELVERLNRKVKESEEKLAATKEKAMMEVSKMASEVASAIVEKLTGVKPSDKDVEAAVNDLAKEKVC